MPLETGTTLEDLDSLWPLGGDPILQGDDHLRLIKKILKLQFPGENGLGFSKPITATEDELNAFGADLGGKLDVDQGNGPITGNVVVTLAGAIDAILSLRNSTAGLDFLTRADGSIVIGSTNASGGDPQDEIVIDPASNTIINWSGIEKFRVDQEGGDLTNTWRAVTQSADDDSTKIATTAYVDAAVDDGISNIPSTYRYASLWTGFNTSGTFALSEPITNFDTVTFIAGQAGYAQHHAVAVGAIQIGTTIMSACTRLGSNSNGGLIIKFPDANNVQITASVEGQALQAVYGQKY